MKLELKPQKIKIELTVDDMRNAVAEDGQKNPYQCPIGQFFQRKGVEPWVLPDEIAIWNEKDAKLDNDVSCLAPEGHDIYDCDLNGGEPCDGCVKAKAECDCTNCGGDGAMTPCLRAKVTPEVARFIERFDEGKFVKPITVELEFVPDEIHLTEDCDFER